MWMVLGLAVVFFLVTYGQQLFLEGDLKAKAAVQRTANQSLRDENARLKASLQYYQSDKYIEQRAREDLNLRRPDEHVLIPVAPVAGSATRVPNQVPPPAPAPAQPTPRADNVQKANWQRWLDLFSPSP
jgi:hypothetical protein